MAQRVRLNEVMHRSIRDLGARRWCILGFGIFALVVGTLRREAAGALVGIAAVFFVAATSMPVARSHLESERGIVRPGFDKFDVLAIAALCLIVAAAIAAAIVSA